MSSLAPLFGAGFGNQTRLGGEAQPPSPPGEDFLGGDPITNGGIAAMDIALGDKMSAGFTGREAPPVRGARPRSAPVSVQSFKHAGVCCVTV